MKIQQRKLSAHQNNPVETVARSLCEFDFHLLAIVHDELQATVPPWGRRGGRPGAQAGSGRCGGESRHMLAPDTLMHPCEEATGREMRYYWCGSTTFW